MIKIWLHILLTSWVAVQSIWVNSHQLILSFYSLLFLNNKTINNKILKIRVQSTHYCNWYKVYNIIFQIRVSTATQNVSYLIFRLKSINCVTFFLISRSLITLKENYFVWVTLQIIRVLIIMVWNYNISSDGVFRE